MKIPIRLWQNSFFLSIQGYLAYCPSVLKHLDAYAFRPQDCKFSQGADHLVSIFVPPTEAGRDVSPTGSVNPARTDHCHRRAAIPVLTCFLSLTRTRCKNTSVLITTESRASPGLFLSCGHVES